MNKVENLNHDEIYQILELLASECAKAGTVEQVILNVDYLDRDGVRLQFIPARFKITQQTVVKRDAEIQRKIEERAIQVKAEEDRKHQEDLEKQLAEQADELKAKEITDSASMVCRCKDVWISKQALATKFGCSIKVITASDRFVSHRTTQLPATGRKGPRPKKTVYSQNEFFAWYRSQHKSDLFKKATLIEKCPDGYTDYKKMAAQLAQHAADHKKEEAIKAGRTFSETAYQSAVDASELSWLSRIRNQVLAEMSTDPTVIIFTDGHRIFVPENIMA